MPTRSASADWNGSLTEGSGIMALGSRSFEGAYSYKSRFEEGQGTNPEELIGAALAGCLSMSLSAVLAEQGTPPEAVHTDARVHLLARDDGFEIAHIELATQARVPGIEGKEVGKFLQAAETAMEACPVSKALTGTQVILHASLEQSGDRVPSQYDAPSGARPA
jgi:osmotically inducible protein OsmC